MMADPQKHLLDTLNIPAPHEGLEQRIIRAANHRRYNTKSTVRFFTPLRMSLLAVAASLGLLWVMPTGIFMPQGALENGTLPLLVDNAFDEEMDNEWGEQWLEVAFNSN